VNAVRQVEVADDHLMPLGFPNMWTVFKVVDRVTGEPVAGPDIQVAFPLHSTPKAR
jgi:hypothetical protein